MLGIEPGPLFWQVSALNTHLWLQCVMELHLQARNVYNNSTGVYVSIS